MRNTFINTLQKLVVNDRNTILITGDLGYGVLNNFWETYPEQFINAGISEQNMTSVAAGMAIEGKKVFTYSIANFPTLRCLEQIRNDVAYHDADVKIVSIGAGMGYGSAGMSHHATEDLAVIRALPNITVFSPADPLETIEVTKKAYVMKGPCYIRLGKGGEKNIHDKNKSLDINGAIKILDGDNICIFSTGAITGEAYDAANELNKFRISTALYSFPIIKPIDYKTIESCSQKYDYIITLEEHNVIGGFGGAVAEVMAELPTRGAILKRIGLNDIYTGIVGSQEYLREYYGICCKSIVEKVKELVDR